MLGKARNLFWRQGFAGTSLDELSQATGLNRPSLYAAFGNKQALYLHTIRLFSEQVRMAAQDSLANAALPLGEALSRFFDRALEAYTAEGPLGCMVIGTLVTEAPRSTEAAALLSRLIADIDQAFIHCFRRTDHSLKDSRARGQMASSLLFSLAIRARAGVPQAQLARFAKQGLALLLP